MGVNSRDLDEYGYALCCVCKKKFFIGELEDKCEFCGKWFCHDCARETPAPYGSGKICRNCYNKLKKRKI